KTAFLPHATSKINSEKDLFGIKTLGFRGEALASIAAVGMLEIKSCANGNAEGALLKLKGGTVTEESDCALSGGTHIKVENLFFNTPVRLKFLKSERAEESDIINIVSRYILCNPDIRISLDVNGKSIYQSYGSGLFDAICCVYGKESIKNIIKIEAEKDNMSLIGYVGLPSYSKPNRTYQTIALNGRYIINSTISAAMTNAYKDYLMKRQYPFYVLHLKLSENFVDVNVHPNKMDVRFEDNRKVFSLFYNTIYGKLHSSMQSEMINTGINQDKTDNSYAQDIVEKYNTSYNILNYNDLKVADIKENIKINYEKKDNNCLNCSLIDDNNTVQHYKIDNFDKNHDSYANYKIVGSLFDTYIILQIDNDILLIDQHAAHERLLYDKYCNQYLKNDLAIQYLIVPYLLNVNALEYDFIYNNIDTFVKSGFNAELFGDRVFKISSVPVILSDIDLNRFFTDLLKDIDTIKQSDSANDIIKERLMKRACRAAVKAGDKLNNTEIDYIIKQLFDNTVLLCPHGRPILLKYSKHDIEKLFKRIV
ncbi:MAG: DNA mismatch repair endonuclease MutL, partial [Clostridia bacterium]|nr:DNA mismatch repair endonuclease MutL [Clostridia bacterium]